jgi:hypothetical protein
MKHPVHTYGGFVSTISEWGMTMMHSPNNTHETRTMGATMNVKDVALVLKGMARRHLEVPCAKLISRGVSEHQATSSCVTEKATPTSF